jgi:hypothetical protein
MHRMKRVRWSLTVGAVAALVSTGCAASRLAVPAMSERPVEYAVQRDTGLFSSLFGQGRLAFGDYAVDGYSAGWFGGTTRVTFLGVSFDSLREPYHFRFAHAGGAHRVQCAGTEQRLSVASASDTASVRVTVPLEPYRLACEVAAEGEGRAATALSLEARVPPGWPASGEGAVAGHLRLGALSLEVRSLSRRESGYDGRDVIGFEFLREGRVVGAVQTINDGRVWLATEQPPEVQDAVALASSVLMLNQRWEGNHFEAATAQR